MRFRRILLAACLLAFALRAGFAWQFRAAYSAPPGDRYLAGEPGVPHDLAAVGEWNAQRGYALKHGTDMAKYVRYARMALRGDWLAENATISPLASLAELPLLLLLGGGSLTAAMILQGLLGAGQVCLLGLIARRYLSETAALLTALLAALYTTLIIYDALPLTECVINFCLLLAVWLFLRFREKINLSRSLGLGIALGLAVAAKPTLAVLLPAFLLGDALERGRAETRKLLRGCVPTLLAAALVVTPFVLRAKLLTGEWLFLRGNTGYMAFMGNNPSADGTYRDPEGEYAELYRERTAGNASLRRADAVALELAGKFWLERPGAALSLTLKKILLFLSSEEIPNNVSPAYCRQVTFLSLPVFPQAWLVFPLAALGLATQARRRRAWALPLAAMVGCAAPIVLTVVVARLRLPAVCFALLFAAAGLEWLLRPFFSARQGGADARPGSASSGKTRLLAAALLAAVCLWCNREALWRDLRPLLLPGGQPLEVEGGTLYRDGPWEDRGGIVYGAELADSRGYIAKEIALPDAARVDCGRAEIVAPCVLSGGGQVKITLNGEGKTVTLPEAQRGRLTLLRLQLPPEKLTQLNRIEIRAETGTTARFFVDDDANYGRSRYSERGEPARAARFDAVTCMYNRAAQLPEGEFRIGLFLKR